LRSFGGARQGLGKKIAKTTPCKVESTPARSPHAALRPGQEKKKSNLTSSRSSLAVIGYCRPAAVAIFYLAFTENLNLTLNCNVR
jgi:hypothetical protein